MRTAALSMLETHEKQLEELLAHPSVWRGRSRAAVETFPTGFAALDAGLPGGGWPRHGLVEILTPQPGVGELYLLLPALAALSRATPARWCTWVSPPHEPFAPALEAHGVALDRMLIVRTHLPLWAHEQALRSGACEVALAWLPRASPARHPPAAARGRAGPGARRAVSQPAFRAAGIAGDVAGVARAHGRGGQAWRARESAQESRRQPRAHRSHLDRGRGVSGRIACIRAPID